MVGMLYNLLLPMLLLAGELTAAHFILAVTFMVSVRTVVKIRIFLLWFRLIFFYSFVHSIAEVCLSICSCRHNIYMIFYIIL